jgi:hypothetical protein
MISEIKQKWIKDLKSRKYTQGKGWLRQVEGRTTLYYTHCCLGVLADIYVNEYSNRFCTEIKWEDDNSLVVEDELIQKYNSELPEWELTLEEQSTLATMNDEEDKSFSEIADWIEENIKETKI